MASDFIGLQMIVSLRSPPSQVMGTVADVQAGSGLTLANGMSSLHAPLPDLRDVSRIC
jgi:hypothetical protein